MPESHEERPIVVYGALLANIAIAVAKFVVGAISGSSALLAEAIHSTADSGNEILLLIGLRASRRPADDRHPFGHGKELYFWGLMVGVLLFSVGGGMSIYEGIVRLRQPRPLEHLGASFVVVALAFAFEGASFAIAMRELSSRRRGRSLWKTFEQSHDPSVFTVVAEDAAALAGLVVATLGLLGASVLHAPALDAVASLVVGAILIAVATVLVRENRALLVGEGATAPLVRDVRRIVESDHAVSAAGKTLTMHLGPSDILLDAEIEFRRELTGDQIREAIARIERAIRDAHPEVQRIFLEATSL